MNNIKVKITGFDESSGSLLACFSSDETASSNPTDYPSFAFQLSAILPDVNNISDVIRQMAKSGVGIVQQQVRNEAVNNNVPNLLILKSLVGQERQFSSDELLDAPVATTPLLVV